ncbi:MAG: hypothetical protein Q7K26_05630 [bacterium]|nr:hypothetical protein [bacterium]
MRVVAAFLAVGRVGIACLVFYLNLVVVFRLLAGGRPAATPFLCFAKEEEAKKGDRTSLPFGFPLVQVKKWEVPTTRYAQTRALLFPFSASHNRQFRSGILKVKSNGEIA